jgi:hypothetical protein
VSTTKQKEAAKKNIAKAREIQSERAHGAKIPRQTRGLSTAQEDKLPANVFAFPKERKEPLTDAKHVRNAIARFDQVEGVTDAEKDAAWKRIIKAAKMCDVDVQESSWRELGQSSKSQASKSQSSKRTTASAKKPVTPRKTTSAKTTVTPSKTTSAKTTVTAKKSTSARKPVGAKK